MKIGINTRTVTSGTFLCSDMVVLQNTIATIIPLQELSELLHYVNYYFSVGCLVPNGSSWTHSSSLDGRNLRRLLGAGPSWERGIGSQYAWLPLRSTPSNPRTASACHNPSLILSPLPPSLIYQRWHGMEGFLQASGTHLCMVFGP